MVERFEQRRGFAPARTSVATDEGLRLYMLRIYNYMTGGVLLTGIMAMLVFRIPALAEMLYHTVQTPNGTFVAGMTGLGWVVTFSPLGFVLIMSFGSKRMSSKTLQMMFWGFAGVMGLSLSSVLFLYTGASIARTFFVAAAAFGSLSLYGYTTKKDLTAMGKFLFMGLVGLFLAMIVNMFTQSTMMDFIISVGGVLIFAGLTAYDTQRLKNMYIQVAGNSEAMAKVSIMGALKLYLDFINMFLFLLRFMGTSRS